MLLLAVLAGLLGLVVGSFLNVVVHRVPMGLSVVRPPSACPACTTPIRPRDNVPVAGWLLLAGRCRACAAPISARYPVVEALTATLFVGMALRFGLDPVLPAYLYLAAVGLALALIDLDTHRLPDALTLPSYPVFAGLLAVGAVAGSDSGHVVRALLAGAGSYLFYRAVYHLYRGGLGFGDVKLVGVLGMASGWVGWGAWAVDLFAGCLLGAVWGVAAMALGKGQWRSAIPYGPFLLAGCLVAVLVGERLAAAYLDLALA